MVASWVAVQSTCLERELDSIFQRERAFKGERDSVQGRERVFSGERVKKCVLGF